MYAFYSTLFFKCQQKRLNPGRVLISRKYPVLLIFCLDKSGWPCYVKKPVDDYCAVERIKLLFNLNSLYMNDLIIMAAMLAVFGIWLLFRRLKNGDPLTTTPAARILP